MEWLNNPWVVGIGGGVLSGFLVTVATSYFFQKRDNKEYNQKISAVNREVLYSLRAGISESNIPKNSVINSLITSTARRYGVDVKDVYNRIELADELIKEVMDSSFISSSSKDAFCAMIDQIKEIDPTPNDNLPTTPSYWNEFDRKRMIPTMSLALGVVTALTSAALAFLKTHEITGVNRIALLFPLCAAVTATFASVLASHFYERKITSKIAEKNRSNAEKRFSGEN